MDFDIPTDVAAFLAEVDQFIENKIKPLEAKNDNQRFFDHRRENERTDWAGHTAPLLRPLFLRQSGQCWSPDVQGLRVRLFCVALLCSVTRHAAIGIGGSCGLDRRGTGAEVLEEIPAPDLVPDIVPPKTTRPLNYRFGSSSGNS